jgi:ribonuclease P protein component
VLAATQRLRRSSEFAAVIRGGRRAGRGTVVVHLSVPPQTDPPGQRTRHQGPHAEGPHAQGEHAQDLRSQDVQTAEPAPVGSTDSPTRAGFVVSKAVGNAVVRNQVRRRLRHLMPERLAALPAGSMLVVRAQPTAAGTPSAGLAADLDAALAAARSSRRRRATTSGPR